MKNILLATAATFARTTSAFAEGGILGGLGFAGEAAYDIETEATAIEFGPTMSFAGVLIEPKAHAEALFTDGGSLDMAGYSVKATYGLTSNLSVFGSVAADEDFEYDTATVGVGFNF